MFNSRYLEVDIFHAVEYRWPLWKHPYTASAGHHALWLVERGVLEVAIGTQQWRLGEGSVLLVPLRQPRALSCPSPLGVHWWSLNYNLSWLAGIDPLHALQEPLHLQHPPRFDELHQTFKLLARRWMQPWEQGPLTPTTLDQYRPLLPLYKAGFSASDQIIFQGLAQAIFGWCHETLEENGLPLNLHQAMPPWLERVLLAIEKNPCLTIEELAQIASFSQAQLRRLFHQWLGCSPQEYVVTRRMDIAHQLLETTTLPVAAIAASLGYASAPSFARIFRSIYGMAPAQVRQTLPVKNEV
jgi:AraC-like DNA-binding protein